MDEMNYDINKVNITEEEFNFLKEKQDRHITEVLEEKIVPGTQMSIPNPDITGQRFGRLVVSQFVGRDSGKNPYYICDCDCGNQVITTKGSLQAGRIVSCGCYNIEKSHYKKPTHNLSKHPLYRVYFTMYARCYNPNTKEFESYGKKGINICNEWLEVDSRGKGAGFINFYNWAMANGYKEGLSIDRIDGTKGYSPDNCRWVDSKVQSNNLSSNHLETFMGCTLTVSQWAEILEVSFHKLREYIQLGHSIEDAINKYCQDRTVFHIPKHIRDVRETPVEVIHYISKKKEKKQKIHDYDREAIEEYNKKVLARIVSDKPGTHGPKMKDLTGQRFGKLSVTKFVGRDDRGFLYYMCHCDCGNDKLIEAYSLRKGITTTCGCSKKDKSAPVPSKHGLANHRLYKVYHGIKGRCYLESNKYYPHYGGRGIKMCDEWLGEDGFINFYNWAIKNGYDKKLSIDRIDVDKDYCPENCRWVDSKIQANNKTNNRLLTNGFCTFTLSQWAEILDVPMKTLRAYLDRGHSLEEAMEFYHHGRVSFVIPDEIMVTNRYNQLYGKPI